MTRYILCGGCTTAVNVGIFYILRIMLGLPLLLSNFVSISAAILFAFIVNKVIVFGSGAMTRRTVAREFTLFLSMRLISMAMELGGVWFIAEILGATDLAAKLMMQAVVIISNFFFSKYIIFRKKGAENGAV